MRYPCRNNTTSRPDKQAGDKEIVGINRFLTCGGAGVGFPAPAGGFRRLRGRLDAGAGGRSAPLRSPARPYSATSLKKRFFPARSMRAPSESSQPKSTLAFSSSIFLSLTTAPPCWTRRLASLLEGASPA